MKFPVAWFLLSLCLVPGVKERLLYAAPPLATNDHYTTVEDTPLLVNAAAGLLANDHPSSNAVPAAALVGPPAHGELSLNPDGSFTYIPAADFGGQDSFSYKVFGDRQAMALTVDEAHSSIRLGGTLRVELEGIPSLSTDSDSSHLTGAILVELAPTNPPFTVLRLVGLTAVLTDAITLEFGVGCIPFLGCLAGVQTDTITNDIALNMTSAGPTAAVATNGSFYQDGNQLQVTGHVIVQGTGQLTNLLPQTNFPLDLPAVPAPFSGRITAAGGEILLELPLNYRGAVSFADNTTFTFSLTGTIHAKAPLQVPPVEESGLATVSLEIAPVNDAPVAAPDSYLVRADSVLTVPASGAATRQQVVPAGSAWKYLNSGVDQATAWRLWGFDDTTWPTGPAELGYGDAGFLGNNRPEATLIRPRGTPLYPAVYFRKEFLVTNANDTRTLTVELLRDDGAAVYLNGRDIARQNLPTNTLYSTLALAPVSGTDETRFFPESVDPALLLEGRNVLAVEVHQASLSENLLNPADLSFDLGFWRETGLTGLLANDADADSPSFGASVHTPPAHGTLTLASNGGFVYTPEPGFSGSDAFIYQLSDGETNDAALRLWPRGSLWKFKDDGSDQGTAWREPDFNDAGWESGAAELGYGDDNTIDNRPETTQIQSGPLGGYYVTTYFRAAFHLPLPRTLIRQLKLHLLRDDGAAVYLNGVEIVRDNLPPDADYLTGASLPVEGPAEARYIEWTVPVNTLAEGRNVLAVELHQNEFVSSDASFDLELVALALPGGSVTLSVASDDTDADDLPDSWERQYGLDFTTPDGDLDPDHDQADNYSEYIARTDPQDAASVLRIQQLLLAGDQVLVRSTSVPGRPYQLQTSPDLVHWTKTGPVVTATGPQLELAIPAPPAGTRAWFCRVHVADSLP